MKSSTRQTGRFGLINDRRIVIAFTLASLAVFALLLLAQRPHWASPWLVASFFTFLVWRLNRKAPNA